MMNETFGQRFARLRKARSLTQDYIADRVNVTPQAVSKWENDISSPDISILGKLADILDVTTDELLGKENASIRLSEAGHKVDLNHLVLKINCDTAGGDMVRLNLPVKLIQVALAAGNTNMISISDNNVLQNIDFAAVLEMVEQGVLGTILEARTADGDNVTITVEEV